MRSSHSAAQANKAHRMTCSERCIVHRVPTSAGTYARAVLRFLTSMRALRSTVMHRTRRVSSPCKHTETSVELRGRLNREANVYLKDAQSSPRPCRLAAMSYTVTLWCGCSVHVSCNSTTRIAHTRVVE